MVGSTFAGLSDLIKEVIDMITIFSSLVFLIAYPIHVDCMQMASDVVGRDLYCGIMWVLVISWHIVRRLRPVPPKPLYGIINIEFKEIRR